MNVIDAKGLACPQPVILAKKAIDGGEKNFTMIVDNKTAVENLMRLADNSGYKAVAAEKDGVFEVAFSGDGTAPCAVPAAVPEAGGKWAIFVPSDTLGRGESELGASLIKMFFYTLAQEENTPDYILFMNAGVTLPCNDEVSGHLRALADKGVEILVCGTCLNFYGLKEELKVGTVSNMYDILQRMQDASKVITL